MSLVSKQQFDELVGNTTTYLQQIIDRLGVLEEKVKTLEENTKPKATTTRARSKQENANNE